MSLTQAHLITAPISRAQNIYHNRLLGGVTKGFQRDCIKLLAYLLYNNINIVFMIIQIINPIVRAICLHSIVPEIGIPLTMELPNTQILFRLRTST